MSLTEKILTLRPHVQRLPPGPSRFLFDCILDLLAEAGTQKSCGCKHSHCHQPRPTDVPDFNKPFNPDEFTSHNDPAV